MFSKKLIYQDQTDFLEFDLHTSALDLSCFLFTVWLNFGLDGPIELALTVSLPSSREHLCILLLYECMLQIAYTVSQ